MILPVCGCRFPLTELPLCAAFWQRLTWRPSPPVAKTAPQVHRARGPWGRPQKSDGTLPVYHFAANDPPACV